MIRRAVLLASALLARGVCAQTYDIIPDSSDNIPAAVERAVQHMFFIARPIARHRLLVNNPMPQHVHFDVTPDTITLHLGDQRPLPLPRDGTVVPWVSTGGDKCQASLVVAGDTLIERVTAHGGQSETRFVTSDSGRRLREAVRITSSHLPQPVVYSILFAKAP